MSWEELYSALKHDCFYKLNLDGRKEFIEKIKNMDFMQMQEGLVTYFETIECDKERIE